MAEGGTGAAIDVTVKVGIRMPSLRGAQRRSNPERVKVQRGLDRFAALAMTEESQQGMREREKLAMTDATFDHSGSRFDALLDEEGLLDEAEGPETSTGMATKRSRSGPCGTLFTRLCPRLRAMVEAEPHAPGEDPI